FPQTKAMVEPNTLVQSQDTESKLVEKDLIEPKEKATPTEKLPPQMVKVSIPRGTHSSNIANTLVNTGRITSSRDFEDKGQELDLAKKLRSGEFDIVRDSSVETIVKIIATQK